MPPWNYSLYPLGSVEELLGALVSSPLASDLKSRAMGNLSDIVELERHVSIATELVKGLQRDLVPAVAGWTRRNACAQPGGFDRLMVAMRLLHDAMLYVDGAVVFYARTRSLAKPSLSLARTGLEICARAAWIATGSADEVARFLAVPKEPHASTSIAALAPLISNRWPSAEVPKLVYDWLSAFTHYDVNATMAQPSSEDVYAALAYVGSAACVVAELLIGDDDIFSEPRMPAQPPWLRAWPAPPNPDVAK